MQVHGVVHGGVLAALADTAGGLATYMACPRGTRVATIEMKINYLEAVEGGSVTAEARVVRIGGHIAVVDCDVRDDRRLVGKALMTFFVGPFRKNRKKGPRKRALSSHAGVPVRAGSQVNLHKLSFTNGYSSELSDPPDPFDPFVPPCAASSPSL